MILRSGKCTKKKPSYRLTLYRLHLQLLPVYKALVHTNWKTAHLKLGCILIDLIDYDVLDFPDEVKTLIMEFASGSPSEPPTPPRIPRCVLELE